MVTKIMNHSWLPKVKKSAEHGEYAQGTLKAFPRNTRYKNSFKRCFNHVCFKTIHFVMVWPNLGLDIAKILKGSHLKN